VVHSRCNWEELAMKHNSSVLTDTRAFTSFSVDNVDKARAFYRDTLGLEVADRPEGLELDVGAGNKVFLYSKPDHKPATFTVLNFPVDDVEVAVDHLKTSGVKFEQYDLPLIKTNAKGIADDGNGPAIAWFKDPAGNILSVLGQRAD
jgi:catechol 2,3-dioxygenase-like lactoylglutathione lyase family enzyme